MRRRHQERLTHPQRSLRWIAAAALAFVLLLLPRAALAYPWMIRHEYTGCTLCHTDPSGGGLLTAYGRAQAATLLSSGLGLGAADDEPGKVKDFAFGVVPLPETVDAQGWVRSAYLVNMVDGKVVDDRLLLMRADVGTHVRLGPVRASGSIGAATARSRGLSQDAWISHSPTGANVLSREHWVGVDLADEAVLVRAGRIAMPFGLRNIEHPTWVRSATRSDTNQHQQHGVAASYNGGKLRAEGMLVAGNFQLNPDAYRERGYAAYGEYALGSAAAVGVSSAVLHADADLLTRRPLYRQAHGVFARFAPIKPLVLLAETDAVVRSVKLDNPSLDLAALVQADYEAVRGVHVVATGEVLTASREGTAAGGGWLSAWVFLFAHMDARVDLVQRGSGNAPATTSLIFQLHGWL